VATVSPRRQVPVGLLAAGLAALAFVSYPLGPGAVIAAFFAAVLVTVAAIDLRSFTIPNRIVLPATAVVLAAQIVFYPRHALQLVLASLLVAALLLLPHLLSSASMGMGDVKLALLLGAMLGWGAVGALMIAFLAVLPFALATILRGGLAARKVALPFGPFMALGALVVLIAPGLPGIAGL
jgi:prepilin signal peptidase PulO-like enzyme (type II secretory pathway)